MESIVVYYSKSGNTKSIAENIASKLDAKALPINLITKKGRGTKVEQEKEKSLFDEALNACREANFVIIGTPTNYGKACSMITRFAKEMETKNVGIFCTCMKKSGTTISGLEKIIKDKDINILGTLKINLKRGQFNKLDDSLKNKYFQQIDEYLKNLKKQK